MPKIIDHKQRKADILYVAFKLFAEKGYQNTSLSHLAEACKISRPTLYQYFRDKDEIFHFALKRITDSMLTDYKRISRSQKLSSVDKIKKIYRNITLRCFKNTDFILSLSDFMFQMRYEGQDYNKVIARRTIKLRYLLRQLFLEAEKKGEIRKIPAHTLVSQSIAFIESFIFHLILNPKTRMDESVESFELFLDSFRINQS